jgi:DNA-binding MarR family transcriptional regulator
MAARNFEDEPVSDTLALAEDLRRAIGSFVRIVRDRDETQTSAQSETLGLLDREGRMNVAVLAQRRGVTHQTMRLVVGQLQAGGLVERLPDPTDRRSQLVSLTDAGRRDVARSRAARASRIGTMIEDTLSAAERAHLRQSIVLLERLCAGR